MPKKATRIFCLLARNNYSRFSHNNNKYKISVEIYIRL